MPGDFVGYSEYKQLSIVMLQTFNYLNRLKRDQAVTSLPAWATELQVIKDKFSFVKEVISIEVDEVWHPRLMELLRNPPQGSPLHPINVDEELILTPKQIGDTAVTRFTANLEHIMFIGDDNGNDAGVHLQRKAYVVATIGELARQATNRNRDLKDLITVTAAFSHC